MGMRRLKRVRVENNKRDLGVMDAILKKNYVLPLIDSES